MLYQVKSLFTVMASVKRFCKSILVGLVTVYPTVKYFKLHSMLYSKVSVTGSKELNLDSPTTSFGKDACRQPIVELHLALRSGFHTPC